MFICDLYEKFTIHRVLVVAGVLLDLVRQSAARQQQRHDRCMAHARNRATIQGRAHAES